MKDNTVCLIDLKFLAVHHHRIILIVYPEECHRVGFMIQAYQMPVIWKQRRILGPFLTRVEAFTQ